MRKQERIAVSHSSQCAKDANLEGSSSLQREAREKVKGCLVRLSLKDDANRRSSLLLLLLFEASYLMPHRLL